VLRDHFWGNLIFYRVACGTLRLGRQSRDFDRLSAGQADKRYRRRIKREWVRSRHETGKPTAIDYRDVHFPGISLSEFRKIACITMRSKQQ